MQKTKLIFFFNDVSLNISSVVYPFCFSEPQVCNVNDVGDGDGVYATRPCVCARARERERERWQQPMSPLAVVAVCYISCCWRNSALASINSCQTERYWMMLKMLKMGLMSKRRGVLHRSFAKGLPGRVTVTGSNWLLDLMIAHFEQAILFHLRGRRNGFRFGWFHFTSTTICQRDDVLIEKCQMAFV